MKGKAFLAVLILVVISFFGLSFATVADVVSTSVPDQVGPGPPMGVLILVLSTGAVIGCMIIYPPAPPYSIGGFSGSLDLNNNTSLNNEYTVALGVSSILDITKNAVTAVQSVIISFITLEASISAPPSGEDFPGTREALVRTLSPFFVYFH